MRSRSPEQLKAELDALLDDVRAGDVVLIEVEGRTIAKLVPVNAEAGPSPSMEPRQLGIFAGTWVPPDDFDDPLPDEVIALFEGRD